MRKMLFCLLLAGCISLSLSPSAAEFSDVAEKETYYEAVSVLSDKGIISGYEDGTFRPMDKITRAEVAALLIRAMGKEGEKAPKSIFSDVDEEFWGKNYIMLAAEEEIINGYGNGLFGPADNVTYHQIIKMLVCMAELEEYAEKDGGWPMGYVETAYRHGIITAYDHQRLQNARRGNASATRGDGVQFLYNTAIVPDYNTLTVGNREYHLGMRAEELEEPDEVLPSCYGFDWYVYGTDTYAPLFAVGTQDGRVVILTAAGRGFSYLGYKAGDTRESETSEGMDNLKVDMNDGNIIHAVKITRERIHDSRLDTVNTAKALEGESKMNFHFTNAFRVYHGVQPLRWCGKAAEAARLHSQDMADKNYFAHASMDGTRCGDRLRMQGIAWKSYGENISGGRRDGVEAYNGWVNSAGHRTNMLRESYVFLGVGGGYNHESKYARYFTQAFYA